MADDERIARQKALAEKKRRLEEIKARRQNRPAAVSSSSSAAATATSDKSTSSVGGNNLDDYIDSLLKTSPPSQLLVDVKEEESKESSATTAVEATAVPSSVSEGDEEEANHYQQDIDTSKTHFATQQQQAKVETFDIAVQCEEDDFPPPSLVDEDEEGKENDEDDAEVVTDTAANNAGGSNISLPNKQTRSAAILLSAEEKHQLVSSAPFAHFLSTASKRVERLLGATDEGLIYGLLKDSDWGYTDFSIDYAAVSSTSSKHFDDEDKNDEENAYYQLGGFFTAKATYSCPKWTNGRNVTDIEWCPSHKEWVLASYNNVKSQQQSVTSTSSSSVATRNLSPNEQLFSSYFTTSSSSSIPNEGIIAIYNLTMPQRPEHVFCSGCPIVHTQFHPVEHPKLILGGGTSGQILIWDARVGRYPVQRSSIVATSGGGGGSSSSEGGSGCVGGHDVELVGMKVLGGDGIAGGGGGSISTCKLVTASSDGKVNYWSVSNLRDPVEQVKVNANLSCLDVLHYEGNNEGVVCGDERGGCHAIFASSGRDGGGVGGGGASKRVVRTFHPGGVFGNKSLDDVESIDSNEDALDSGHYGMVTAIAARPAMANNLNTRSSMKETTGATASSSSGMSKGFLRGAGGLLVTTGVDWSTKLWAPGYTDAPLMSFLSNSYDYMTDVQWSPVHPSIFATASSNGTVNIWNLAASLDQPISGTEGVSIDDFAALSSSSRQGLNRLKWSGDGRRMAVASGDKMHVLSVGEDVWKSKGDEEGKVMNNLLSRGLIHE